MGNPNYLIKPGCNPDKHNNISLLYKTDLKKQNITLKGEYFMDIRELIIQGYRDLKGAECIGKDGGVYDEGFIN